MPVAKFRANDPLLNYTFKFVLFIYSKFEKNNLSHPSSEIDSGIPSFCPRFATSTSRFAESWMLHILDPRMTFIVPCSKVVVGSINMFGAIISDNENWNFNSDTKIFGPFFFCRDSCPFIIWWESQWKKICFPASITIISIRLMVLFDAVGLPSWITVSHKIVRNKNVLHIQVHLFKACLITITPHTFQVLHTLPHTPVGVLKHAHPSMEQI